MFEFVFINLEGDDNEAADENDWIECGEYEVYSQCNANPICQRTCETLGFDDIPCPKSAETKSCIGGCICQEDYVRFDAHGQCIHNNRCPRVRH